MTSYILVDFVTLPAQHRVNAPQQSLLNIPKLLEALYNDELVLNIVLNSATGADLLLQAAAQH